MTNHISDDLPRLLTGEAPRDVVLDAAAHLRTCADCQQELVSAVVAHASLTSAQRFAPEVVAPAPVTKPAPAEPRPLPDLDAVFRQVRAEAAAEAPPAAPLRRNRMLIAAAAAVVVVGGGIGIGLAATSGSSGPPTRTVALETVGTFRGQPTVTMVGTERMKVNATSLPQLASGLRYEVWLANAAGKMQAVGFVGSDRTAELTLTSDLIKQYSDVAISEQRRNQPLYSGVLVARGSYA
jgi:hypothetical protein